jgi:tetratricopeptide (TPR) repeat protein
MAPVFARADGGASAAELKSRADDAMNRGAFASAIFTYRASYALSPSPALLYNIGNAYEHLGDYPHALSYLERFASAAPPTLKERVPHLDQLIETVRGRIARISVRCGVPGARVLVRGALKGTTPLDEAIAEMPGDAHVEVIADGYLPYVRDLVLAAGKEARVDAELTPELATRPTPAEHAAPAQAPITTKWWFWTGVGVVVAGGTAAAIVALSKPGSSGKTDGPSGHAGMPLVSW